MPVGYVQATNVCRMALGGTIRESCCFDYVAFEQLAKAKILAFASECTCVSANFLMFCF